MQNISSDSSKQRFLQVLEVLEKYIPLIPFIAESLRDTTNVYENSFDSFIANCNNPEDIEIAKFLKQEELDRENGKNKTEELYKENKNKQEQSKKAAEKLANETILINYPRENEQIEIVKNPVEKNKGEER